jgi:hypothetical protein
MFQNFRVYPSAMENKPQNSTLFHLRDHYLFNSQLQCISCGLEFTDEEKAALYLNNIKPTIVPLTNTSLYTIQVSDEFIDTYGIQ